MNRKEQLEFNERTVEALEDLLAMVHRLTQGRTLTDDQLLPLYKKLAGLRGLTQP